MSAARGAAGAAKAPAAQRREQLLIRSTVLRARVAQDARVLEAPLAVADRVRDGVLWLRNHPEWGIGAVVLLVLLKPRAALGWAARGWAAWRVLQRAQRLGAALSLGAPRRRS